jgi:hypothetical protein
MFTIEVFDDDDKYVLRETESAPLNAIRFG